MRFQPSRVLAPIHGPHPHGLSIVPLSVPLEERAKAMMGVKRLPASHLPGHDGDSDLEARAAALGHAAHVGYVFDALAVRELVAAGPKSRRLQLFDVYEDFTIWSQRLAAGGLGPRGLAIRVASAEMLAVLDRLTERSFRTGGRFLREARNERRGSDYLDHGAAVWRFERKFR